MSTEIEGHGKRACLGRLGAGGCDRRDRLTRIIHDGSSRNRGAASRDGRVEPRRTKAYLKQYVEGLSGEPARLAPKPRGQACRSSGSAIAAEAHHE
jgi:hypothetical protein